MVDVDLLVQVKGMSSFHPLDFGRRISIIFEKHNLRMRGIVEAGVNEYAFIDSLKREHDKISHDEAVVIFGVPRDKISKEDLDNLWDDLEDKLDMKVLIV